MVNNPLRHTDPTWHDLLVDADGNFYEGDTGTTPAQGDFDVYCEAQAAADAYLQDLTVCLPVDRAIAELACHIRAAAPRRLPLVDALIAATARSAGAVLVHKDPHMAGIPAGVVKQLKL